MTLAVVITGDEVFELPNLLLLALEALDLLPEKFLLLLHIGGVVARIAVRAGLMEIDDLGDHSVEEIAVVGDDQHSAWKIL